MIRPFVRPSIRSIPLSIPPPASRISRPVQFSSRLRLHLHHSYSHIHPQGPRIGRICRRLSFGPRPSSCTPIPAPFPPHPSTTRVDDRPLRLRPLGSGPMSFPRSLRRLPSLGLSSGSGPAVVHPLRAATPATASSRTASPKPSSSLAGRQPAKCLVTQTTPKLPPRDLAPICFNSTIPRFNMPDGLNPREPDGERKVKLGKSKLTAVFLASSGQ